MKDAAVHIGIVPAPFVHSHSMCRPLFPQRHVQVIPVVEMSQRHQSEERTGSDGGAEPVQRDLGTEVIREDGSSDSDLADDLLRASESIHDPGAVHREQPPGDVPRSLQPEEEDEAGAESPTFKQSQWRGTTDINAKYFKSIGKEVPLDKLAWDLRLEHGQSRTVDDKHVQQLVVSLQLRPPREPLKITVWENEADRRLYVLAGQHLSRAVQQIRDDRDSQGLKVEHWQKTVRADILMYSTPISVRRIVAGQENASTKIHRATTVSECIRLFQMDRSGDSFQERVVRAVEQAGLN